MDELKIRRYRIINEHICTKLEVTLIEDKMKKNRLRWFVPVQQRPLSAPVSRADAMIVMDPGNDYR